MYLSKIHIKGFRNFNDKEVLFNDGVNVIIGPNNSGKTNLLRALSLVIDSQKNKRLTVDDFYKNVPIEELKTTPPKISIALYITQSEEENLNSDDLVSVGNWLVKLEPPYEALLTYEFFLPEKEIEKYKKVLEAANEQKDAWQLIASNFIRLYTYKIWGGDPNLKNTAESESLQKFDYQFLDAIRDVERDMFSGHNTMLRDVLDFFIDYEIKNDSSKSDEVKEEELKTKKNDFSQKAESLLKHLHNRMENGKKQILSYAENTGASFNNAKPNFEGSIADVEVLSALKLIVEYETGISIPVTHNGLGYNNLIFISLLLAKMQVSVDGNYLGSNAKVFPVLSIEEPEAHLHPAMQYKFLNFLRDNKDVQQKARQIFVTTHSTQITSAVSLDEIICLHSENGELTIGYPGKVFTGEDGEKSKAYVQRFLDATKSDMLFAQKVILVEGLAEQILISTLAKYLGIVLEDYHISVINVGGRYFEHFLKLFNSQNDNIINKKIACLTDRDPERKPKNEEKYKKCYPFEYNQNESEFDYKNNASEKITSFTNHPNIRFFSQEECKSKTFEYDLALFNPNSDLLLTKSINNQSEIKELMQLFSENKPISDFELKLRSSDENTKIIEGIDNNSSFTDEEKKKAIIASRYLNSVSKGENALELSFSLEENLSKETPDSFNVPTYIKEAIEWICQ